MVLNRYLGGCSSVNGIHECGLKISNSCAGDFTKKYQRSKTNKQVLKGTILLAYCYDRVCLNGLFIMDLAR